jgi:hypothetical protein
MQLSRVYVHRFPAVERTRGAPGALLRNRPEIDTPEDGAVPARQRDSTVSDWGPTTVRPDTKYAL